jgi:hypothetical protein
VGRVALKPPVLLPFLLEKGAAPWFYLAAQQ